MKIRINEEYKKLVPTPSKEDYDSLVRSIIAEGLQNPIVVNQHGVILDGHTRYAICQKYDIPIKKEIKRFDDPLEERIYVLSTNLNRRHINKAQRARLALTYLELLQQKKQKEAEEQYEENKNKEVKESEEIKPEQTKVIEEQEQKTTEQKPKKTKDIIGEIAKKFNIGAGTLKRAKVIQNKIKELPDVEELWKKAEAGEASIDGVYQKVKEIEREQIKPSITNSYIISTIGKAINSIPNSYFDSALIKLKDNKDEFYMLWLPLIFNKLKENSRLYIFTDNYNNIKLYQELSKYRVSLKNTIIYNHNTKAERELNTYKNSYRLIYYFSNSSQDLNKYEKNVELMDLTRTRYQDDEIPDDILEYVIKSGIVNISNNPHNLSIFDNGYFSYTCGKFNIKSISIDTYINPNYELQQINSIEEAYIKS